MKQTIEIEVPEGMEIDKQNSTFECIKFRPKKSTYDDIQNKLYYTRSINTSLKHYSKCITFIKLLEVADYLNGDWKPDWDNEEQCKYTICYSIKNKQVDSISYSYTSVTPIVFSSRENALKAIEIIGEEELEQFFS